MPDLPSLFAKLRPEDQKKTGLEIIDDRFVHSAYHDFRVLDHLAESAIFAVMVKALVVAGGMSALPVAHGGAEIAYPGGWGTAVVEGNSLLSALHSAYTATFPRSEA